MLSELQQLLTAAVRNPDPHAFLCAAVARDDCKLSPRERELLRGADADGLRLSRMLVRKLRLQRVLRGDARMGACMARDQAAFAQCFADYDRDVEPTAVFPIDEARAFRDYCERRARGGGQSGTVSRK